MQLFTTLVLLISLFQPCHQAFALPARNYIHVAAPEKRHAAVPEQLGTLFAIRASRGRSGSPNAAVPMRARGRGAVVMAVVMTVVVMV